MTNRSFSGTKSKNSDVSSDARNDTPILFSTTCDMFGCSVSSKSPEQETTGIHATMTFYFVSCEGKVRVTLLYRTALP